MHNIEYDSTGWDTYNWGRGISFWNKNIDFNSKTVLELGCGCKNGGLSLWVASKGASDVVCSDYNEPTEQTKSMHKLYNFDTKITYKKISALEIPYENHFDIVIFKSMLGGISRNNIEEVNLCLKQCKKALKPGGKLLVAENLVSTCVHKFTRKTFLKRTWRYFNANELSAFLEYNNFKVTNREYLGITACFGRSERQRIFLGKLDKILFERILPEEKRYIIFLIAEKNKH